MFKKNLIVVGFAIVFLIFVGNTFGQTNPVVRRPKTAKIKLPSPKGMNKADLTEQLAVRANGQKIGTVQTNRKRKPRAGSFSGTILEGSNIRRKRPRNKNTGQAKGVRKPKP